MDWNRYKALCDSPDVCSRWLLEQTLELLDDPTLAARLHENLAGRPLTKPADHRGGDATDMFRVDLTAGEAQRLVAAVDGAAQAGRRSSATAGRGLGGFVEAWRELEQFLAHRDMPGRPACSARS